MKNHRVLKITAFAVPNSISTFESWIKGCKTQEMDYLNNLGMTAKEDEPLLQVWIHGDGADNNTDHGWTNHQLDLLGLPYDAENTGKKHDAVGRIHAPSCLPLNVFENAKEGEVRTFKAPNGCIVKLKFEQLPYRYRAFGKFEEITNNLLQRFYDNKPQYDEWVKRMRAIV